jgi:hypothetical protein
MIDGSNLSSGTVTGSKSHGCHAVKTAAVPFPEQRTREILYKIS